MRPGAGADQPGHPLHIHADQGFGRWDNPDLYRALYVAGSASGAVGETFAHLSTWRRAMLPVPTVAGAERVLGVYSIDEDATPLIDLDDSRALLERALRPTDVVIRNRPKTQRIARDIFAEARWSGLSWWSIHRPQWTLYALWDPGAIRLEEVDQLPGHPALLDAGRLLAKQLEADIV